MRIQRRFLYAGVFFIAMGAVLVAAELNGIDEGSAGQFLRLWPVAVIAAGLALVIRRTRLNVAGGMLAVAIPGLALGMLFAFGPQLAIGCGNEQPGTYQSRQGTFDGQANVSVVLNCGEIDVNTQAGTAWSLQTGNTRAKAASVASSSTGLSIETGHFRGSGWPGRDVWRLTVPTANSLEFTTEISAGRAQLNLSNGQYRGVHVTLNAGEARLDLSNATLQQLDATLNAGSFKIELPNADFTGRLEVNLGDLQVCAPSDLGLRVRSDVTLGSASLPDLVDRGGYRETSNYETALRHADLTVNVNLGSVKLNPNGGCS